MSGKKARLGRGIGSLLGGNMDPGLTDGLSFDETPRSIAASSASAPLRTSESVVTQPIVAPIITIPEPDSQRVWNVEIHKLQVNPRQPRKHFSKESLAELASSIREKGILQPITARRLVGNELEIVAGERRWRAAQMAGLQQIPVLVRELSNQDSLELALIENIQRQELNAIEEALAYQQLAKEFNLTQAEISQKVGKDRVTIANTLRLLNLIPEVQQLVIDGRISMGHARALIQVTNQKLQLSLAKQVADGKLSVRATEKLATQAATQGENMDSHSISEVTLAERLVKSLTEDLQKRIGTRVAIDYTAGKGKLSVYFYSDEELNQLAERIKDAWQR
jgi:ParB family chromosome partitioning protein